MDDGTISITFGDRAENHKGMQILGKEAERGLTLEDLIKIGENFDEACPDCDLIELNDNLPAELSDKAPPAYLLILRQAVTKLVNIADLEDELFNLEYDSKAFMYGRVVNKKARHNLCFDDHFQAANYENKKGTVIPYSRVPLLTRLKNEFERIIGTELKGEANYYYNLKKCGIGYHGDKERRIVIAFRVGQPMSLHFQWYYQGKPVGDNMSFELESGDVYVMSEKAVGTDWMKKVIPTLRHAAGCSTYTKVK